MRTRLLALTAVAALGLAACGGGDDTEPVASADPADAVVTFVGNDQLQWEETSKTSPSGEVVWALDSAGAVNHNLLIEGYQGGGVLLEAGGNETVAGVFTIEPGTYTFYCSIPGHRAAGMEGTLVVE